MYRQVLKLALKRCQQDRQWGRIRGQRAETNCVLSRKVTLIFKKAAAVFLLFHLLEGADALLLTANCGTLAQIISLHYERIEDLA